MVRGRGKNAPDRAELMTASGVELAAAEPLPCPPALPEYGADLWRHLTSQAFALQLIRPEDSFLLESLCMHYQVFCDARDAYAEQSRSGRLRELTATGSKRNTEIDIMAKSTDQMVKIAKLMGITPLMRTKMKLNHAASAALMATAFPERVRQLYEAANGSG